MSGPDALDVSAHPSVERLDLPSRFRAPFALRRVGLLLLATDLTTERDMARHLAPQGVAAHATRIAFDNPTTPATLRRMGPGLADAAALLASVAPLSAVYYSCTSATVALGPEAVAAALGAALLDTPVVTPPEAAVTALAALGARRVALLTPYLVETTEPFVGWFSDRGLDIVRAACLGMEDDRDMARLDADSIVAAAAAADHPDAEALFVSCTALPSLDAVEAMEARLGKPVVTSNQAAIWRLFDHAGVAATGPGRLFALAPPRGAAGVHPVRSQPCPT